MMNYLITGKSNMHLSGQGNSMSSKISAEGVAIANGGQRAKSKLPTMRLPGRYPAHYNQARAINHRRLLPDFLQGFGHVVQFVHDAGLCLNRRKEACAS
jgi:hypothetical protein